MKDIFPAPAKKGKTSKRISPERIPEIYIYDTSLRTDKYSIFYILSYRHILLNLFLILNIHSYMKYSIAALFAFSILITSCTSGSGLPRADETTQSFYTPLGDKVFSDAWVSITDAVHSLMILKDGEIVYERYANGHSSDELHIMWSVSKSFTSLRQRRWRGSSWPR